jgi:hypothetical protein
MSRRATPNQCGALSFVDLHHKKKERYATFPRDKVSATCHKQSATGVNHMSVVRDLAGFYYLVSDLPGIDHAWQGTPAKKSGATYIAKAGAKARLVRKAGCTVVATR